MMSRVVVLFVAALLAACAGARVPSYDQQVAAIKTRLLVLMEEERARAGAKSLRLDPQLVSAAQAHSDDMARKRSFDAMNPDGNIAVNILLRDPRFGGFVAENSAAQYFSPATGMDPDAMAQGFLQIWLASPSHRHNVVYREFDRAGIGIAVNGNEVYAAAVFATDFGLFGSR
jgi:uncharacterized protein YkwD